MDRKEKLYAYEKMQESIVNEYNNIIIEMQELKKQERAKTVTYRQLMGKKLLYKDMLSLYKIYGLQEE